MDHYDIEPKDLMDFWNENRGGLPHCRFLSKGRADKARAQIRQYPCWDHWAEAIDAFTSSKFCNDVWRPGFDDFLTESKRIKAIEGIYSNRLLRLVR